MSWISVKDKLPEWGETVIIHHVDGSIMLAWLLLRKKLKTQRWNIDRTKRNCVTHWQPLPEPPKE